MGYVNIGSGAIEGTEITTKEFESETVAYTVLSGDDGVLMTTGSTAKVVNLPKATTKTSGNSLTIKKMDSGGGAVTVTPFAGDTVENASTDSLASQFSTGTYVSDGVSNWIKVSKI